MGRLLLNLNLHGTLWSVNSNGEISSGPGVQLLQVPGTAVPDPSSAVIASGDKCVLKPTEAADALAVFRTCLL